ncbi:MAG: OsmC family protein [Acidobacteriota bacterium]
MAETAIAGKPPTIVQLIWEHDLVFAGTSGETTMVLDSASVAGPSPMQALAFALAGCMAMDVVHVIRKRRHQLRGLRVDLSAARAPEDPHRFTAVTLHYAITGAIPDEAVERAIQLSRDKYCSVWHSLRQDIELTVTFKVTPGV